ncbi:ATP-binding protein [Parasedimentitalea psychrophila]|uniref:histidine kinase n=1 Tax=Parasedimentitalea psychrophila TaxID=2997337 RepID=A0A9Y2L468_9RHOB|nr:ATP-binding protein [Parasedimentitalea psychrophila]WIY27788.1 ATP-binding protein [Parasedimentitalea psychrophila]
MRKNSIRSRIQWRLIPLILSCWVGASALVYFGTRSELRDALNAQADIMATIIARMQSDEIDAADFGKGLERYEDDYLIRIWSPDGQFLFDSQTTLLDGSFAFPRATKPAELGPEWRQSEYHMQSGGRILIARLKEETNELILQVTLTSLLPLALAFLGSILAVLLFVRNGLMPLTQLSDELANRTAAELKDLPDQDQAEELQPIVTSLNGLFDRIRGLLARERRFVDDAAHELRTPLTVIKAQCQSIDPATLDAETKQRLDSVVEGVDRITQLSARLLDQARAEQPAPRMSTVKVAPLLRGVLADLMLQAEEAGVTVELLCMDEPVILCASDDLRVILRNLVENAIKFSADPGRVCVTLKTDFLAVEDNGPGVPEDQRLHVFDRFFQMPETEAARMRRGAGLGLSIVMSLSQRNGMLVSVTDSVELAGACFRLDFSQAKP